MVATAKGELIAFDDQLTSADQASHLSAIFPLNQSGLRSAMY